MGTFVCTVMPKTVESSCDTKTVKILCSKNGTEGFQPKSGGACINIGWGDHVKDSELMWDMMPTCITSDEEKEFCECPDKSSKKRKSKKSKKSKKNRRLERVTIDRDALVLELGKRDA